MNDRRSDFTSVVDIIQTTYGDLINSDNQQDVNLLQLYPDVTVYNDITYRIMLYK